MSLLILAIAGSMTSATVTPPVFNRFGNHPIAPKQSCKTAPVVADTPKKGSDQYRLGDLPDGREMKAVFRKIDGCIVPMFVDEYRRNPR